MKLSDYIYYKDDWATIYCGDCLEIMPLMEPDSVDLVVTDIPFNVGWKYGEYKDNLSEEQYCKNCHEWFHGMAKFQARKVIKIPTKFSYIVIPIFHQELGYKWTIIQYSPNTTSHGAFNLNLFTQYVVSDGNGCTPGIDFFQNTRNDIHTDHPAEMPEWPIRKLIDWFSKERATILDPFLGSGTTCLASKNLNRKSIGIEINPKYCEIAVKRLRQGVFDFRKEEKFNCGMQGGCKEF